MLIHIGSGDDTSGQDPNGIFPGTGLGPHAYVGSNGNFIDLSSGLGSLPICGDYVGADCGDAPAYDDGAGLFSTAGVPEPATWALMIGGFVLMGAQLRRRRRVPA
jgi:hypothetical protein